MWVIFGAEETAFGIFDLREVEFDKVLALEFTGGLDRAGAGCGGVGGFADGGDLGVGTFLGSCGAGGDCFWGGVLAFGGFASVTDGFGFETVGFLAVLVGGGCVGGENRELTILRFCSGVNGAFCTLSTLTAGGGVDGRDILVLRLVEDCSGGGGTGRRDRGPLYTSSLPPSCGLHNTSARDSSGSKTAVWSHLTLQ